MNRIIVIALILMVLCTIPSNAESAREYFKFAKFSYDARDYVKALDYINKAIELEPDYTNGLMLRVEINKEFKNYYAMIPDANRIIIVDNQAISLLSQAHLLRGIAFFYTDNYEKASADFKMAISMNSGIAEAYFYQGLIAYHYSSHFQALEFFDLAIQKEGNNSEYYFYRANLKMEYFQPLPNTPAFDHTMADIIKSIDLNPGDPPGL